MKIQKKIELKKKPPKRYANIDSRVHHIVREFEKHYGKKISGISIVIGDIWIAHDGKSNAGGVCYMPNKHIILNKDRWLNEFSDDVKEEIVFHELGHCQLRLMHSDEPDRQVERNKCPKSIMYWRGASGECWAKKRRYYIRELFSRTSNYDKRKSGTDVLYRDNKCEH